MDQIHTHTHSQKDRLAELELKKERKKETNIFRGNENIEMISRHSQLANEKSGR